MSSSPHEQPYDPSAPLTSPQRVIYERAFVHTVLRLLGRANVPTMADRAVGKKYLILYDVKLAVERSRRGESGQEVADDALTRLDAVQHAFMLVRFGSVLPPAKDQLKAFNVWQSESSAFPTGINRLDHHIFH